MKPLHAILLISLVIRLVLASFLELGNDEVYYYTYALHLQTNYFDHPPGVAMLIRFTTLNMLLQHELFLRLGAILCAATATMLTYKIGTLIKNKRTGLFAAVLYNTSIYSSIISGVFILPDSPQLVFWLAALLVCVKIIIATENHSTPQLRLWLFFGILSGLCMLCKVHGIFLWVGLAAYLTIYKRTLLVQPGPYLAAIITIAVFSPVVLWNIDNHFITWNFHSDRIDTDRYALNSITFSRAFFGQILYNNPVNVWITALALIMYPTKYFLSRKFNRIILLTGLPIIIITTAVSLFNTVLPHWSGPGFLTLSFIAAAYLDYVAKQIKTTYPFVLKASILLILTISAIGLTMVNFYPGTVGKHDRYNFGKNDFTLDMWGWKKFEKQFSSFAGRHEDLKEERSLKIVCNKWFPASHIDYYVARPLNAQVIGLGSLTNLHHYAWLNKHRTNLEAGENAVCIVPSNYSFEVNEIYKPYFSSVKLLHTFCLKRSGLPAKYVSVYSLNNYTGHHNLPR